MKIAHYSRAVRGFSLGALLVALAAQGQQPPFEREVESRVLVNGFRAEQGLRALEREARLDDAAGYFANFMAAAGRLDHDADGATPPARAKQRGYAYCMLGENIGMEYDSRGFTPERLSRALVQAWRESPTHRANMLDATVTQTGIGVGRNARGEYYATQVFARPRPADLKGRCR